MVRMRRNIRRSDTSSEHIKQREGFVAPNRTRQSVSIDQKSGIVDDRKRVPDECVVTI